MKIISKYKDYYDYLVGVYGEDPLAIFDRRIDPIKKPSIFEDQYKIYSIAIVGRIFKIYQYKDKFYYTPKELLELNTLLLAENKTPLLYQRKYSKPLSLENFERLVSMNDKLFTDVNHKLRKPILLSDNVFGSLVENENSIKPSRWSVIRLEDFHINKYIPAESIFKEISAFMLWLNDNPEIPNNQTNEEKILTHGFDLKHSFRNTK
jgi:hypothetical protein